MKKIQIISKITILISLIIPILYTYINKQILWDISWWSVVFIMIIRPLADVFPKFKILRKLVFLRKAFGILSASIVMTFFVYKAFLNPNFIYEYFSYVSWKIYTPIIGRISEITGLLLLITSNRFSQKKLGKWWKRVQRLSYIYFISGGIIIAQWEPFKVYPMFIIVIILWILAKFKVKLWK